MLRVEELAQTSIYGHISRDVIDSSLDAALKVAVNECYPTMAEADREGCHLENGNVRVPRCFHSLKAHYDRLKLATAYIPLENGGSGYPMSLWTPLFESFVHNLGFLWLWSSPFSTTNSIVQLGSEEQKKKYLPNLVSGKWGSAFACTEEHAGSDIALQTTIAVKQSDGSYRIKGTKPTVTSGDSDLFDNMVLCVLARVEGDPANATGCSLFLVPKYLVTEDGSLGQRNDYSVVGLERKMGLKGSPTAAIVFGDNGNCYAELLGERRQAMPALLSIFQRASFYGITATGIASAAYLHSVNHSKNRIQGAHISDAQNPDAPRVPIIAHPFVRRLLLWMKAHVEGMRALVYYSCLCLDKANSLSDPADRAKWSGLTGLLAPISRLYTTDRGFKVTEAAIQVHGRYGFFSDYPVEQFMRDITPLSLWEVGYGVHTLLYVAETMGQNDGRDFVNLLHEMHGTIEKHRNLSGVQDLVADVEKRVDLLGEMGRYFAHCAKEGKALIPISNGMPFMHLMGDVCVGWLLLWQACIATKRLTAAFKENDIDPHDAGKRNEFLGKSREAAFYDAKVNSARFFIKNVLPQVDSVAAAIKNEDLSLMMIHENGF